MDRNFFLAIALSLLVLVVWSNFESQRRKAMQAESPPATEQEGSPGGEAETRGATTGTPAPPSTPSSPSPSQASQRAEAQSPPEAPAPAPAGREKAPEARRPGLQPLAEQRVVIRTDLYEAELTSRGGALLRWELENYVDRSRPGNPRVTLTTLDEGAPDAQLETPFTGLGFGNLSRMDYAVDRIDSHHVVFHRQVDGVTLRKSYLFEPGTYSFRLKMEVENGSDRTVAPRFEVHWRAVHKDGPDFADQALIAMYEGSLERARIASLGQKGLLSFRSLPMEGKTFPRDVEWAGMELRYFLAAIIPDVPRQAEAAFTPIEPKRVGDVALRYEPIEVPVGRHVEREYRGFIGPKVRRYLEATSADLEASATQGWAWVAPLAKFFNWTLELIYKVIPNYGVAIILLTVMVRLVTAPLTAKQMRSMKKMGELQPRMKELQAKYGDDRQKQSEEMMKLYRETGVNPLGGCLPMVLQFPVFIGLYYALQSSIDLRQAPFMLWIDDLSRPESLFMLPGLDLPVRILPLIMGASMVLQQRMSPSTMDPQQARMMMTVMPVMFTVLFYQFPSGLVLYWMVSNLLAIGHQVWVNRRQ